MEFYLIMASAICALTSFMFWRLSIIHGALANLWMALSQLESQKEDRK